MKILPPSPLKSLRTAALLVGALATLVYANSLGNGLAYDDVHIVTENTAIHSLETLPDALSDPYWPGRFGRQLGLWRPAATTLIALEYAVAGEDPLLYHAVNVAAHAATSVLVLLLLVHLMSLPAALAGGLIFAVHPVHVEAVANVIGIAEVMSTGFFVWACLVHVRGPERTSWGRAAAIATLYALAFGTKEGAVTLPGAIFLLDAARRRIGFADLAQYVRDRWRAYLAMGGVAGVLLALRFRVLGGIADAFGPLGADLLEEVPRIWTLAEVWSHYVRLWVFPLDLSADYSPNVIPIRIGWGPANVVGLVLALGVLTAALVLWRRRAMAAGRDTARTAAFGVVWFIVTISPVANVLFVSGILLAERTFYLPSVGLAAASGWLVVRLARERPWGAWVLLAVALTAGAWRTWDRNPTWRDNITVFGTLIEDYPHSGRSQWILGDLFFQQGRVSEGLVSYRAAVNILGPHYKLVTEIARKLISREYNRAAEHLLEYAWREEPDISVAPGLLAVIASERGDPVETERYARAALALDDDDPVRYHLLAWALTEQGRYPEAAEARRGAIDLGEGDYWQQWVSLAYLEANAGDTLAAREALDSARSRAVTTLGSEQVEAAVREILAPDSAPAVPPGELEHRGNA